MRKKNWQPGKKGRQRTEKNENENLETIVDWMNDFNKE